MKHVASKVGWLVVVCAALAPSWADAMQSVPWQTSSFYFNTRSARVADLLRQLGSSARVPIVVSSQIGDAFSGSIQDANPTDVLNQLSSLFGLAWYYDGQAVYVYRQSEIRSAVLTPRYLGVEQLGHYLRTEFGDSPVCTVRAVSNLAALQVFGVPVCVDRAVELTHELDDKVLSQAENQEDVKVFRLKNASAADTSYSYRGQTVAVPGVVSVLQQMTQGRSVALGASQPVVGNSTQTYPMFSADARENAVIVRDRAANMSLYEKVIESLDRKARRIEIAVMIVDVDSADLNNLGVTWQGQARVGHAGISFNTSAADSQDGFSSILPATAQFMVRLDALAQKSKARIVSQPSIVTLENVPAVLDKNVTFYTKLSAERYASLASVTAGSLLKVTPRVIDSGAGEEIMLNIDIQDGRQGQPIGGTEQLPQVQSAEISSQATLQPGESLLLGGFEESEQSDGVQKIPLLGDIPFIGGLFRSRNSVDRKLTRLFLIKAAVQAGQTGSRAGPGETEPVAMSASGTGSAPGQASVPNPR